jgi:hypothetical protein
MKNLFAALTVLLTVTSANAFFNDMEFPYADNNPYDNGMVAFNAYDMWDARWYAKEFINVVDEFDKEFSNDYNPKDYHSFPAKM